MKISTLTFIDIETTGFYGPQTRNDAIIEIAAAIVDVQSTRILERFETLIRPWGSQTELIQHLESGHAELRWRLAPIHEGFRDVDWSKGESLTNALSALLNNDFLKDGVTVAGQNPRFDLDHLRRDAEQAGFTWPRLDYHTIDLCSPAMFLHMRGLVEGVGLKKLIPWAYADPERKQSHRAMQDVLDSIQVFFAMHYYFNHGAAPHPGTIYGA